MNDSLLDPYAGKSQPTPVTQKQLQPPTAGITQQDEVRLRALARIFADEMQKTYITAALPAHNEPHWYSTPVDLSGRVNVAAAAAPVNVWQTITTYTVEPGRRAVIRQYGVDVLDPAYTYDGSLLWQVTVNGNAAPTLEAFAEHRGSIVNPRNTFILLKEGDIVALRVRREVAAVGAQDVDGVLVGWTFRPRRDYDGSLASVAH